MMHPPHSPHDTLTESQRSERMSKVRSTDTGPEMVVRRLTHALGYRYRLHRRDLPGQPDLVFSGRRKVIFVHGCFWHRHEGCPLCRLPKGNLDFWQSKLAGNQRRDRECQHRLEALGWRWLVIWECETNSETQLRDRITNFLEATA